MPRAPARHRLRCWRQLGTLAIVAASDDLEKIMNKARNYPHWELSEYTGDANGVATYRLKEESA